LQAFRLTDIITKQPTFDLVARHLTGFDYKSEEKTMKLAKNFVFAVLFVSALTVNTYAGDQETPGYYQPPPPTHSLSSDSGTDGRAVTSETETSDSLLYEALAALLSVF
jgi:hypothetical protein